MARLLLHSDMPVVAAGLRAVLGEAAEFELSVVAGGLPELRTAARALAPQVILLDLTAEIPPGILAQLDRLLLDRNLVLWVYEIPAEMALQALSLGVRGILRSTLAPDLLLRCLRRVQQGELWYEKALVDDFADGRRPALTGREIQLVRLLAQGLKNKEIAAALQITEGTVKVYFSRLFRKLGVQDRFELALYGLRHAGAPATGRFR